MTHSQAKWMQLSAHPNEVGNVFLVNDHEFLMVDESNPKFIHTYNIRNNKWNKIFKFSTDLQRLDECGVFYDKQSECLYFAAGRDSEILYEVNIHKNIVNILSHQITNAMFPRVITIHSKVHIIGGDNPENKHLIYDTNTKQITDITSYNYYWCEALIHLESRNSILMVGKDESHISLFGIYEFSLTNSKWSEWDMELPPIEAFASVYILKSRDEQYILMIAGYVTLNIHILNIESNKLKQSQLRYPCNHSGRFAVINMNSKTQDEILVFGYVKKCFQSSAFNTVQHLPHYLVKFISCWLSFEMIHFMLSNGQHWNINIDDILCSLTN